MEPGDEASLAYGETTVNAGLPTLTSHFPYTQYMHRNFPYT